MAVETDRLNKALQTGGLAKGTTDSTIRKYSNDVAFHSQAASIVNNPISREGMTYMQRQVDLVEHSKGSTNTERYGDMRTYGGGGAAKQRASNTRLDNETSLNRMDDDEEDEDADEEVQRPIGQFAPQMEATARASLNSAAFNRNIHATMGPVGAGGTGYFGYTPPQPLSSITPHHTAQIATEETPAEIEEVRDEACMEICSKTTRGTVLQGVVDGLSRPRDKQLVRVNELMTKQNKTTTERLDKLVKFEENRRKSKTD